MRHGGATEYRSAYGPVAPPSLPPSSDLHARAGEHDGAGSVDPHHEGGGQGAGGAGGLRQRLPGPVGRLPEMDFASSETLRQRLDVPWPGPERDGGEVAGGSAPAARVREEEPERPGEATPFPGGAAWASILSAVDVSEYNASVFGGGIRGAVAPDALDDGRCVPRLPVVVSHLEPCGEGFVTVLEDPTGKVRGTFHASVFTSYPDVDVGSALLLKGVSVVRLERRAHIVVLPEFIAVHYPRAALGEEPGAEVRESTVECVGHEESFDDDEDSIAGASNEDAEDERGQEPRGEEEISTSAKSNEAGTLGNPHANRSWAPPVVRRARTDDELRVETANRAVPSLPETSAHVGDKPTRYPASGPEEMPGGYSEGSQRSHRLGDPFDGRDQSIDFYGGDARVLRESPNVGGHARTYTPTYRSRAHQNLHHPETGPRRSLNSDNSVPAASRNREPAVYKRPRPVPDPLPQQSAPRGGGFSRDIGSAKDKYLDDCRRDGVDPNLGPPEGLSGVNSRRAAPFNGVGSGNGSGKGKTGGQGVGEAPAYPKVAALLKMDENGDLPEELSGEDPEMLEQILGEMMLSDPGVTWEQVKGLQFAKASVFNAVILPSMRPDLFTGIRQPERGLLLFGPPGTGKTLIGKAIASQAKSTFFSISASSLTSKWIGVGEKLVRSLFAVARNLQPSVIFIDEIDSMLTSRGEGENDASRRLKTEFLCSMDGAKTKSCDRVLVVGATNRPQDLDEAVLRRLAKRLYVPLPDEKARHDMIIGNLTLNGGVEYQLCEDDFSQVIAQTEGYSGSDMFNLVREAAMGPVMDTMQAMEAGSLGEHDSLRPIVLADFLGALSRARRSVSGADLKALEEWNDKFGSFKS